MNFFSFFKCICYLAKWSKYLYFIKKLLCIVAIAVTGVFFLGFLTGGKKSLLKGSF